MKTKKYYFIIVCSVFLFLLGIGGIIYTNITMFNIFSLTWNFETLLMFDFYNWKYLMETTNFNRVIYVSSYIFLFGGIILFSARESLSRNKKRKEVK